MHSAISWELENVQQSFWSTNDLEISSYPSNDEIHQFITLHIFFNTAQDVGRAEAAIEKILNGHTTRGGKDLIWHEFFLKSEEMALMNILGKQYNVFIYGNARKCILSLCGNKEYRVLVEYALLKTVDNLAISTFEIDLNDKAPQVAHQAGYRRIVERLGKTTACVSLMASPRTIIIHGTSDDADWASAVLREEFRQITKSKVEEHLTCAVY